MTIHERCRWWPSLRTEVDGHHPCGDTAKVRVAALLNNAAREPAGGRAPTRSDSIVPEHSQQQTGRLCVIVAVTTEHLDERPASDSA